MNRRFVVHLLARLDASPLPTSDRVRLELEAELIALLVATAPTVRAIPLAQNVAQVFKT